MAKKDGDHPEFDDINFSEEESNESGSDALSFSGLGLGGSELGNNSGLFDFSEDGSSEESSLDLAGAGDDDVVSEEPLDLEVEEVGDDLASFEDSSLGEMSLDESATDELVEPDLDAIDESESEAEPAPVKGKKGKKAKKVKAKKEKKPKKVKEKKEKVVKERKPRSPSDKSGLLTQARQASPFMVMLFISAASLFIAIVLLLLEWSSYGFSISAS